MLLLNILLINKFLNVNKYLTHNSIILLIYNNTSLLIDKINSNYITK